MSLTRHKILLDCDPGHDDAVAIITAAYLAELVGITTVHGNAPLTQTTYNARVMRDLLDIDVPIHSGAARPLKIEPSYATNVHGDSGLDGADLPAPRRAVDGEDAAEFIIDTVRNSTEPIWLVPVGPLTNIATALKHAPSLARQVAGISLMGGGSFGNRTAVAEFNIWADPDAAAIVFECGAPLTMAGLDLTHQFIVDERRIEQVGAIDGILALTLAQLFAFFSDNYATRHRSMRGAALHDPCAVLAVCFPDMFTGEDRPVAVETSGAMTAGQTVIDRRDLVEMPPPNCRVLSTIDSERAWATIVEAISYFSTRADERDPHDPTRS